MATKNKEIQIVAYKASKGCDAMVRQYLDAALADNTLRAYRSDLKHFVAWGGIIPATPARVAKYIAHHASSLASSTLSRRLIAIARAHTAQGFASPTQSPLVTATLQGVRRSCRRTIRQVAPLQKTELLRMLKGLNGLQGMRDAALLLLGFASAMRRSELVSLDVSDIEMTVQGMLIRLRRSKTDQEGGGRDVVIPRMRGRHCPVRALETWLNAANIEDGALFRRVSCYDEVMPQRLSAQSVALIIKRCAAEAGLDSSLYSGHSLRAGFVTNAARCGASSASIRGQTGHQSDAMLLRYVRLSQRFSEHPLLKIW